MISERSWIKKRYPVGHQFLVPDSRNKWRQCTVTGYYERLDDGEYGVNIIFDNGETSSIWAGLLKEDGSGM